MTGATHPEPARSQSFWTLQAMRGVAAIAVAFYHTHIIIGSESAWIALAVSYGWMGVNFFFLLSGFIIIMAHRRDIGVPSRAPLYVWRRISRVYPIYCICLSVYLAAAYFGIGTPEVSWDWKNLASAYLLVPIASPVILPLKVAWTLFYEVMFYAAFLVLILNKRLGICLIVLWVSAVFANAFLLPNPTQAWPIHSWNLYFLIGAGCFYLYQRLPTKMGWPMFVCGLVLLVGLLSSGIVDTRLGEAQQHHGLILLVALPFALILLGGVLGESHTRPAPRQFSIFLGDASYSIYLVHSPVISVGAIIVRKLHLEALNGTFVFLAVAFLSVVAGVFVHVIVERPMLAWLRQYGQRFDRRISVPKLAAEAS